MAELKEKILEILTEFETLVLAIEKRFEHLSKLQDSDGLSTWEAETLFNAYVKRKEELIEKIMEAFAEYI
jgi:hypothetical protein